MSKEYNYETKETVLGYVYSYKAAKFSLEKAKAERDGSFYGFMSAVVFAAFALEAYANHLGAQKLRNWNKVKKGSTWTKLESLAKETNVTLDPQSRPFKTLQEAYRIRNQIAHGKTETVETRGSTTDPDLDPFSISPGTDWQAFCNEQNAGMVLEDLEALVTAFHEAAGLGKYPFVSAGRGSASVRGAKD